MCRQKQSTQQIGALFLLIIAAVLLSIGEGSSKGSSGSNPDHILFHGIVPVLVASVLSGLASALCQWASQVIKIFQFSGLNANGIAVVPVFLLTWLFPFITGEETHILHDDYRNVCCGKPVLIGQHL